MLNVKQTIKNLIGLELNKDDLINDVICCFDTTEEEIIVNKVQNSNLYQAYENIEGSALIIIEIEDNKIIDAWEE